MEKTGTSVRLNIYLPDISIRRAVKTAAAARDLSMSEYCLGAISERLRQERHEGKGGNENRQLRTAVKLARVFQQDSFGEIVFSANSADLIREARQHRNTS
ncbi:MAG: hypothetical protein ACE5JX_12705 [Acidobacteriota bacterium]